jgi:hypothetical protein
MTPPTGNPEVPAYVQKAKDIQQAIEVKSNAGVINKNNLGIELNLAEDYLLGE